MPTIGSGIIIGWPSSVGSIPGNWSRVTDMDSRFPVGTANGVNPNATGGANTHAHTSSGHTHSMGHTHSTNTTAPPNSELAYNFNIAGQPSSRQVLNPNHSHSFNTGSTNTSSGSTSSGDWSTSSNTPAYYEVIWVQSNGNPSGFPNGCIVFYNDSSAPSGWTHHAASKAKFLTGAGSGAGGGGTGGGGSHTHTSGSHTHAASAHSHNSGNTSSNSLGNYYCGGYNGTVAGAQRVAHSHSVSASSSGGSVTSSGASGATSGASSYEPTYHTLMAINNTSGSDASEDLAIVPFLGALGSIPDDFILCDGSDGTPDLRNKFIKAANSGGDVGTTGGTQGHQNGTAGHTHTSNHTHSSIATGATSIGTAPIFRNNGATYGGYVLAASHTHGASGTTSSSGGLSNQNADLNNNADSRPAYRTVAWLQYQEPASGNTVFFASNF
jgi:hypothetical protein